MKILFYIHGITDGGAERVLSTLANSFVEKGEEVSVATNTNILPAYSLNSRIRLLNLKAGANEGRHNIVSKLWNAFLLRKNIRCYAKKETPDIIIAMMSSLGCNVILFTIGLGIPVIVSEHTNVSRSLGILLSLKRKLLYPWANCITVLTKCDYNLWKNEYRNVVRMPNPIDIFPVSQQKIRNNVVLAAGRVSQWKLKGFDNLIKSWGIIWRYFPEWKLQIAGGYDDNSKMAISRLVKENECKNVELLGFRNDIKELMASSEVFCLSSRVEGLPMVLIEAMNMGCCCVSFDVQTGPNEIIENGKSGLLAKNQDVKDLADKLYKVMSDAFMRKHFSSNALTSIQKYATENVVQRWYILFDKILNKNHEIV